jgi:hypothetical protein
MAARTRPPGPARYHRPAAAPAPPRPHPHRHADGTANIRGPATKEEKAKWDEWRSLKADFEAEREELRAMLADPACEHRQIVEEELASTEKVLEILGRLTRA